VKSTRKYMVQCSGKDAVRKKAACNESELIVFGFLTTGHLGFQGFTQPAAQYLGGKSITGLSL